MTDPDTREIIVNLRQLSENVRIGLRDRDRVTLLEAATGIMAGVDQLQIDHPGIASASLSADGSSAAWFIKVCSAEFVREMSLEVPDWEGATTSFTFMEEGVRHLLESTGVK